MKKENKTENKTENNVQEILETEKGQKRKEIGHTIMQYVVVAAVTVLATLFFYTVIVLNSYVPSESMESTLMTGDMVLSNRLAYKFGHDPERYDIVVFYAPDEPDQLYIKRVIGLPGEKVTIKDGKVYINDNKEPLDDSFIEEPMDETEEGVYEVPTGHYFMLGDNRNVSYDSRCWETPYVSKGAIVAKAVFKYWKGFKLL